MLTLDLIMSIFVILAIAAALGAGLAAIASAVLPAHTHRRRTARIGAILPVLCIAYVFASITLFPNSTSAAAVDTPLPNHYSLSAVGTAFDAARINSLSASAQPPQLLGTVQSTAVLGDTVFGQYTALGQFPYFSFDTTTGQVRNYATLSSLQQDASQPIHLQSNRVASSSSHAHHRALIVALPPVLTLLIFFYAIFHLRRTP